MRIKRRVRIKHVSTASSIIEVFNQKSSGEQSHLDNRNAGFVLSRGKPCVFSQCTNLNTHLIRNPSTRQIFSKTAAPMQSNFSPLSSNLVPQSEQILMGPYGISNQLTGFSVHSQGGCTQANVHIVNLITTTTTSASLETQNFYLTEKFF